MPQLYPGAVYTTIAAATSSASASSTTSTRQGYTMSAQAGDATGTVFVVQGVATSAAYIDVFVNGIWQNPNSDYTLSLSGANFVVTFTNSPAPSDSLLAVY